MRPITRGFFAALLALAGTTAAYAETSETNPSIEPGDFALVTELQLETAFERTAGQTGDSLLHGLAGPTTMNCSYATTISELETCVVTAEGTPASAVPAALAKN